MFVVSGGGRVGIGGHHSVDRGLDEPAGMLLCRAQFGFYLLELGDVARNSRDFNDMPLRIADRKDVDQRNVGCAVFARSPLFPGYGLARLEDVFARSGCTGNLLGKKEEIESLSDRFPGCVAVYFLGSRIPPHYTQPPRTPENHSPRRPTHAPHPPPP